MADAFVNKSGAPLQNSIISKNQLISCVDVISEGPIYGLVNGAASIYLDDKPASDKEDAAQSLSRGPANFAFTTNSTSVTVTNFTLTNWTGNAATNGRKWVRVEDALPGFDATVVKNNTTHEEFTITSVDGNFFAEWMVQGQADSNGVVLGNTPYIKLHLGAGMIFLGHITDVVSPTVAKAIPITATDISDEFREQLKTASTEYRIEISVPMEIASIASNVITLVSNDKVVTGTYSCDITELKFFPSILDNITIPTTSEKFKAFSYDWRPGIIDQECLPDLYNGKGSTTIPAPFTDAFVYADAGGIWPDISGGTAIEKTSSNMRLSVSTARQVDEVRVVFSYTGLISVSNNTDSKNPVCQAYKIEIAVNKGSGFGGWINFKENGEFFYHIAKQTNAFYIQEKLDLSPYKPFTDFKLKFTKATRDDIGVRADKTYDEGYTVQSTSILSQTICVIKEKLNHPYTALAEVTVDAEQFNSVPKRSYLCRGKLVPVPSNYVTREEAVGGVANYRRNPANQIIHATDEYDWDGKYRGVLTYTDNPAWVFHDIISHTRYGLGTWLKSSDIDRFSLYRIARYCDELVPDGTGGLEPRFRANIYLTKAVDSYKVLKDMATTFRAILYWSEGAILPVVDQAKDPVYNFTKGNVIEGVFNYEGTGSKVRSNQVVVTWNNPVNDYEPEALLVEDKLNIVKTGKIISEEAVAFGATSIGQATRYGRWKLWTAINQSEIVSFATAINASFVAPGDIVNIQDADRYDVAYSGRISSTGTLSTTSIPLDRSITLNNGSIYELSILLEAPVAFLAQDSATILVGSTNTPYVLGDILDDSLYTNELTASNIQDTSSKIVQINWGPYTHVETQTVNTSSGTVTSLTVDSAFTDIPNAETIWALKETVTSTGSVSSASKKMYKILNIKEAGKNKYDITAVEHYNEKFKDIEIDFGMPYVDSTSKPTQEVPVVTHITTEIT